MPDNIRITKMPALLSRLALYIRIQSPVDDPPPYVFVRVETPGGELIELGGVPLEEITKAVERARQDGTPYIGLILKAFLNNVSIETPGRFSAIARLGDKEYLAGTLNVKIEEEPPTSGEA